MGEPLVVLLIFLAGIYALVFWTLSLRYPAIPLALIVGLAPFQNDLSGFGGLHFSASEVHLFLSSPLLLFQRSSIRLGWMASCLGCALMVTTLLAVPSWRDSSLLSLVQMFVYWGWAVIVCSNLPRRPSDLVPAWTTLLVVGVGLSIIVLVTRSNYILGLNKNGIGASLACALVVACDRWQTCPKRIRWRYALVLIVLGLALVFVLSRGAWIAAFLGVSTLLIWRAQYLRLIKIFCVAVPVVGVAWAMLPTESREYALGFDDSRHNIYARRLNSEFALEQWLSSPMLGVGVGLRKEYDATNVLLLTLAESGPIGVIAFLAVHGRLFAGVWARRRCWPSDSIHSSAVILAGALAVGKFVHGMVDHYWSRGAIMIVWASVGMAVSMDRMCAPEVGCTGSNRFTSCSKNRRQRRWPSPAHTIS